MIKYILNHIYNDFFAARATDFDLDFGATRSADNYAVFDGSVPLLSSFTVCVWFRSEITENHLTYVSYASPNGSTNEMALYLTALSSGARLSVYIKNHSR